MVVQWRNLEGSWHDPIDQWPYEGVITTMERGLVSDWKPILRDIRERPFGRIAGYITHYAQDPDDRRVAAFFTEALRRAREAVKDSERDEVVRRIRRAIQSSGLSQADFATRVGTSASRLSTYLSGQTTPSATMLVRIERAGADNQDPSAQPAYSR